MLVVPEAVVRPLSECTPGSLVRPLGYVTEGAFALTGQIPGSETNVLIGLHEDGPTYDLIQQPADLHVLLYSDPSEIEIDTAGAFEPRANEMYESVGCIRRDASRWLLNVRDGISRNDPSWRQKRMAFDLVTGDLVSPPHDINNICVFGGWSVTLAESTESDRKLKIFSFAWVRPSK